jgi:hypothetical protein
MAAGPLHTNFRLQRDGEYLALFNILDDTLYEATFPKQFQNVSYGLYDETGSEFGYLASATPGQANSTTLLWAGIVSPVEFSRKRGFFETPFTLELTSDTPGATIRYTLDGSQPSELKGLIYTNPIFIDATTSVRAAAFGPDQRPSATNTHSYIFVDDLLQQPANPPGFPETWGVHDETIKGFVAGTPVQADYELDPELMGDPGYVENLRAGLVSIPSISIVTEMDNLDIYAHPREEGPDWERPASIELIDPADPDRGFQIDAGIRMHGDLGRREYMHKHSFRLFFRDTYGAGQLNYPLFPDSSVDEFNTLVLRAGVQDSYLGLQALRRRTATYTRDEWMRVSQVEMSGYGSHGRFVHLYLNGLYWGLYNRVERPDHSFASAHFDVAKDEWLAFNHGGNINGSIEQARRVLEAFAQATTPAGKFAALEPIIDTGAFADYVILNWYAGTGEWAENNWYAGLHYPTGKIKYFVWDGELTWREPGARLGFGQSNPPGNLWPNTVELFFDTLIENTDFRSEFADRLYKQLFNDGALTDANSQSRFLKINRIIDKAILGEFARWGDSKQERPLNRDDWLQAITYISNQMEGNADRLIALARASGYYPPIDPPRFSQQGGLVDTEFRLKMAIRPEDGGTIYYTTDGSDPRTQGTGAVSSNAQPYDTPLQFSSRTRVKARLRRGDVWSALNEATFFLLGQGPKLRISEIMYNPPDQDDSEFVELQNFGDQALDLAGMSFEGIRYTFPQDTAPLAAGELTVLVRNAAAFARKYPDVSIGGVYTGQLSNKGEEIRLTDRAGNTIITVAYDDEAGWPISPDGRGDSLVLVDLNGDPADPRSWRASTLPNGSPGTGGPAAPPR